jgi:hypothetical protein
MVAYKRLPKDHHKGKAEIAARKRRANAERQRRFRKKYKATAAMRVVRAARKATEDARIYDWARILPHVDKREDGCWIWTGPFRRFDERARPALYAGVFGVQPVDHVVMCLAKGRPPPRCFVRSICDTLGCVAPDHLVWSNHAVERAKRRLEHDQKGMAERRLVGRREQQAGHEGQPLECGQPGSESPVCKQPRSRRG